MPSDLEDVWRARLKRLAPVAVTGCLLTPSRGKALKILLSRHYPWRQEFFKGAIQFCLVFAPRRLSSALARGR